MKMYCIHVTVQTTSRNGWTAFNYMPTFYLAPNVQGIVDETHAVKIAADMFTGLKPNSTASISATVVDLLEFDQK